MGTSALYVNFQSFGHVRRRNSGYDEKKMLRMVLPGRRNRERSEKRFMDVVSPLMTLVWISEK